jgi:tRNA dimethylallyltransferase
LNTAVILGPTAVGKSAIAQEVARKLGAILINVDARTVYKDFDIGTAKPSPADQLEVQHVNLSVLSPAERDSPVAFAKRVQSYLENSSKPALYCGGSTLYLQQVLFGSDRVPERSERNNGQLNELLQTRGKPELMRLLQRIDPEYALRVDGFNPVRILRALDVWMQTGRPFSSYHSLDITNPGIPLVFGIARPFDVLKERIAVRVESMFTLGLVAEVQELLARYNTKNLPAFATVGYKEILQGLEEGWTEDKMRDAVIKNTIQYAKRQVTWFKRWPFIIWIDAENESESAIVATIVSKMGNFGN